MNMFDKEINLNNQYGKFARSLNKIEGNGLFLTNRDALVLSSIYGFLNKTKSTNDYDTSIDMKASIMPSELMRERANLRFIYHLMMLLEDNPNFKIKDYIDRTFRDEADDEHPEKLAANMNVFISYAEGGVGLFFERFGEFQREEGYPELVEELYQFVEEFAEDVGLKEFDYEGIEDF